jgi:hypothetical protein
MARCEATTRSGERCKLDAQPGSRFCHIHSDSEEESTAEHDGAAEEALEWEDLVPLLLAGAAAAGLFFFLKAFGRWIPRF